MKRWIFAALVVAGPALAEPTPPPASAGKGIDTPGSSATNGVITPPAMTDPGMAKPAPRSGSMTVVKPQTRQSGKAPVVPK